MSKLLDRLEKIERGAVISMGFGASVRAEKIAPIALVAKLSGSAGSTQGASLLAKLGADAVLIDGLDVDRIPKRLAKALEKQPWGLNVKELKDEQAAAYREKGCDFLAFGPEEALLGAIQDDETGYVLTIQPDMEERRLRAIEDIPVDAVLLRLDSDGKPLTLQHLLTIGSVRGAFSKYLFLEIRGTLSTSELESLRDMGVNGLVIDLATHSSDDLETLKDRMTSLPRQQRAKSKGRNAILPGAGFVLEDEDYDDED